jgi:hypothetical protein
MKKSFMENETRMRAMRMFLGLCGTFSGASGIISHPTPTQKDYIKVNKRRKLSTYFTEAWTTEKSFIEMRPG